METILLVEDDPSVRNLVRQLLEVKGYTVLEAGGSRRALQVCRSHRGKIHLLVTDLVMPQVSGRDLAQILAPLCPEMKVLYMSGYSDISAQQNNLLERGVPLLQKPFTLEAMTRKVREVLDGGAVPL